MPRRTGHNAGRADPAGHRRPLVSDSDQMMYQLIGFLLVVALAFGSLLAVVAAKGRCRHPLNSRVTLLDCRQRPVGWRCKDCGRDRVGV
jgi:hypothetical protein